jgi:thymidine kinase
MTAGPVHFLPEGTGWIEVICGSMFSGKTEELIRRLRRARIANQSVRIYKPAMDQRYDATDIVSHSEMRIPSRAVTRAEEILELTPGTVQVVGVDEGQFFEMDLVAACSELARRGVRVVVAGLEQDYLCRPFPTMAALMVEAEFVTKSLAICVRCGNPALRNQRTKRQGGQIVVGGAETYEACCRRCYRPEADESRLFSAPVEES